MSIATACIMLYLMMLTAMGTFASRADGVARRPRLHQELLGLVLAFVQKADMVHLLVPLEGDRAAGSSRVMAVFLLLCVVLRLECAQSIS